jgi:hypothetical protein
MARVLAKSVKGKPRKPSAGYMQKRVSEIESGRAIPTGPEAAALSSVLQIPEDRLVAYFKNPGIRSAVDLFERLTQQKARSVMLACFSGRPRIPADPEALDALREAIVRGFCFGMCIPFPRTREGSRGVLETYYEGVRERVRDTHDFICKVLDADTRKNCIAAYEPKRGASVPFALLPPYFSRYALVAEELPTSTRNARLSLYLWVETAESRNLQLIGTMEDEGARIQIEAWRAYFSELLDYWMEHKALPKSGLENWAILS